MSMRDWGRRGWLAAALLGLGGCGFRPLYGDGGGGERGPIAEGATATELAAVRVGLIPERNGQVMRRRLQERLGGNSGVAARYDLQVGLAFSAEGIGIRRDGTPSRVRTVATATWFLTTASVPPEPVANGAERTLDAFNVPENQFFAADVSRGAMERRLVEQLADDIARRLAVEFRRRAAAAA